jgi:hypothetical protein
MAIRLADVVNATDVFVTHSPGHAHLAMKSCERCAVTEQTIGKKFERHWLAKFEIVGAIDFSHAPLAEQANDPVAILKDRARDKTRVVD